MRSRSASTERRGRAVAVALLLLSLAAAAALAWTPTSAHAAPKVPPPNVADWPQPRVCDTTGPIADPEFSAYCQVKHHCDSLSGGGTSEWTVWCGAVSDGARLQGCLGIGASDVVSAACATQRRELAAMCVRRPSTTNTGPDAWLCEQYFLTYDPDVAPDVAAPAVPAAGEDKPDGGAPDVFASLGARSPLCNYPRRLNEETRTWCETSGSVAHGYPLSHYGLDVNVATGQKIYQLGPLDLISSALQTIGNGVWNGSLVLVKLVLLLLEWVFQLPLVTNCTTSQSAVAGACESAMPEVAAGLQDLHHNVLGSPWMLAAFAAAGVGAMWTGLVRQRITESLGGLAATVALMSCGLVIIGNPGGTVGELARISNEASLGMLNAASTARGDNPTDTFAQAHQGLFDALVRRPWCALQFGDVEYCTKTAEGAPIQVADVWLAFESNSGSREALFKVTKGETLDSGWGATAVDSLKMTAAGNIFGPVFAPLLTGFLMSKVPSRADERERAKAVEDQIRAVIGEDPAPQKVRLQETGGTPTRLALLATVLIAQLGAVLVLGSIAIRLLMASVVLMVILLVVPIVMLMSGLGQAGRANCLLCARRLAEAVAARFICTAFLLATLFTSDVLSGLKLGWFAVWMLQLAFWWGVLIRRNQLLGFFRLDAQAANGGGGGAGGGLNLMGMYWGMRAIGDVGRGVRDVVAAPIRAGRANDLMRREAQAGALDKSLDRTMRRRALGALGLRRDLERQRARGALTRKAELEDQLAGARRVRGDMEERLRAGGAGGASGHARQLQDRREALRVGNAKQAAHIARAEKEHGALLQERDRIIAGGKRAKAAGEDTSPHHAMLRSIDWRIKRSEAALGEARDAYAAGQRDLFETEHAIDLASRDATYTDEKSGELHFSPGAHSEAVANASEIAEIERLKAEERRLAQELQSPEIRWAESFEARDAAGHDFSEADVRGWLEDRRATDPNAAPDADENLLAAGFTPDEYHAADPAEQERMRQRSREAIEHDRRLFELRSSDTLPADVLMRAGREAQRDDPQFTVDAARRRDELRQQARDDAIRRRRAR